MAKTYTFGYATLLTVLQCIALAFLILACLSAPVFKNISLAKLGDIHYGVFGYCQQGEGCSSAKANYHPENLSSDDGDWKMKHDARKSLGNLLIVTPVAAGLTLLALVTSFLCQFKHFDANTIWFCCNFSFSVLAFIASALCCISTILLFYPHVTWTAYILIGSAVLTLVCLPLCFLARSETASNGLGDGSDDEDGEYASSSSMRDKLFKDELNQTDLTNMDDLSFPEYYKAPKIVTTTTLNSNTVTDSDVSDSYLNKFAPAGMGGGAGAGAVAAAAASSSSSLPYQRASNNNVNNISNSHAASSRFQSAVPKQPFSVIDSSTTSVATSSAAPRLAASGRLGPGQQPLATTDRIASDAPSSVYTEQEQDGSNNNMGMGVGVGPSNAGHRAAPFTSSNDRYRNGYPMTQRQQQQQPQPQPQQPQQPGRQPEPVPLHHTDEDGVLQDLINGVLPEDEEEFLKRNTIDPSDRPPMDAFDEDGDGINDDDSEFTSVSQRGINPRYYQGRGGIPPQGMQYYPPPMGQQPQSANGMIHPPLPQQQQQQQQQPMSAQYYPPMPNHGAVPPPQHQQGHYQDPSMGMPMGVSPHLHQQPAPPHQQLQQRSSYSAGPSASDFVLQSNPEFTIGSGPASLPGGQRAGNPNSGLGSNMHYKPAYKKRLPRKMNIAPASMSRDSPYGGF